MWSTKWWCIEIGVNGLTICKVMFLWSGSGKSRIYLSGHKRQKGQCTSPSTSFSPSLSSSPSSRSSTLSSCFPSGHKCQEGQCTPADKGKKGYKCVCRTGYEGRFCETKSKLYQWVFYLFALDLIFVVMFALKCNSWKMVFLRCCFYADETIEGGGEGLGLKWLFPHIWMFAGMSLFPGATLKWRFLPSLVRAATWYAGIV